MYPDKTVRRRRAVLALLVLACFFLLTAYFGESSGGGLHSVQRGVSSIVSPIQSGASSALKPARDAIGWVGDTFDAKGENKDLRKENQQLRAAQIDARALKRVNDQLRGALDLDKSLGLDQQGPKAARIIGRSALVLDQTITINKGSSDGVRKGQPVMTGDGLVGEVADVISGGTAQVKLITDADFGTAARLDVDDDKAQGYIQPAAGSPRTLQLAGMPSDIVVKRGNIVVTLGTTDPKFPSKFPPNVPIGKVTSVKDAGADDAKIRVRPYADVRDVDYVTVLTQMDTRS